MVLPSLPPLPVLYRIVLTILAAVTWMLVSSLLILLNKHILSDAGLGFHYPMAVSALGMLFSTIASFVACKVLKFYESEQHINWRFYVTHMLPVGLCMAAAMACGNQVYIYLSVAFFQMLKAFTPVVTQFMAFLFRVEQPSVRLVGSVFVIATGVAVSSYGEVNFNVLGVLFMFVSQIAEAIRLILSQKLLQGYKFSAMEALMYLAPACVFWLALGCFFLEYPMMMEEDAFEKVTAAPHLFVSAAAMGFIVNVLSYVLLQLTGAVELKVLSTAKDTMLVIASILMFGDNVTGLQLVGYTTSIVGFFVYNHFKMAAVLQDAQRRGEEESLMKESLLEAGGKGEADALKSER